MRQEPGTPGGLESRMQCNIDARGKRVRLVSGLIAAMIGAILTLSAAVGLVQGVWPWVAGAAAVLVGAFQIFEGWCGWCALRAMGFRTKV